MTKCVLSEEQALDVLLDWDADALLLPSGGSLLELVRIAANKGAEAQSRVDEPIEDNPLKSASRTGYTILPFTVGPDGSITPKE